MERTTLARFRVGQVVEVREGLWPSAWGEPVRKRARIDAIIHGDPIEFLLLNDGISADSVLVPSSYVHPLLPDVDAHP